MDLECLSPSELNVLRLAYINMLFVSDTRQFFTLCFVSTGEELLGCAREGGGRGVKNAALVSPPPSKPTSGSDIQNHRHVVAIIGS